MNQTDRGHYKNDESAKRLFFHSCLGKIIILGAFLAFVLFLANQTIPDEETMMNETTDNIYQCIAANDNIQRDWIDDAVGNIGNIFTEADSLPDEATLKTFYKYNRLEYQKGMFHSKVLLFNNFHSDGVRAGIGIFGIVIPTVNFNDFLLRVSPIHKGYNQRLIEGPKMNRVDQEYFGENPDLGNSYNTYEGGGSKR